MNVFPAQSFLRKVPDRHFYLLSPVGPTTARRIVDRFGLETLDILEAEPERLQEIRGITAKKAMEIGELFRQHMGLRQPNSWQVAASSLSFGKNTWPLFSL